MVNNFRLFFGRWLGVIILAVVAGLVVWFLLNFGLFFHKFQNKFFASNAERELRRLESLYKNDKYGGKTPEETFDLFISALKKGDMELASKYFVLNKQDDWKKTLEEYKLKGLISDFVVELENTQKTWEKSSKGTDPNSIEFYSSTLVKKDSKVEFNGQKLTVPAGDYLNTTRFEKYPSGIWKISLL